MQNIMIQYIYSHPVFSHMYHQWVCIRTKPVKLFHYPVKIFLVVNKHCQLQDWSSRFGLWSYVIGLQITKGPIHHIWTLGQWGNDWPLDFSHCKGGMVVLSLMHLHGLAKLDILWNLSSLTLCLLFMSFYLHPSGFMDIVKMSVYFYIHYCILLYLQGSFCVCTQPMRDEVTMERHLSWAGRIHKKIPVLIRHLKFQFVSPN